MTTLINMEMSKAEAKEETQPSVLDAPKYPWGLCITLNDESLKKLGIETLPSVDTEVVIVAKAVVSRTSEYQTQGDKTDRSLDLQITDMQLDAGSDLLGRASETLYDKK